jgi:hypothetical protein
MAANEFKFPDEDTARVVVDSGDDIEVEIVDDTPPADRGREPLAHAVEDPSDDEIASYSKGVQARIKELTHARHDERRSKEAIMREKQELENFSQQLLNENRQLKGAVLNGTQHHKATAQAAAEAELIAARRQYKDAQDAFDTDAIIAAQENLTDVKMKLDSIKKFQPTPLQETTAVVQPQQAAPVQSPQPDEKSLRWQAKNQWFGAQGFEEVTSYALGLHQKLVNSGVDPRGEEYFNKIDTNIKAKFPEVFSEGGREKVSDASRKPSTTVASATRSSGPKRVVLTTSALALAKKFHLTPQQYAAQVALLESKNG